MTDQTPNSLIKVDAPITSGIGTARLVIYILVGMISIYVLQFTLNNLNDPNKAGAGIFALIMLIVLTAVCARSDYALYQTQRLIIFKMQRTTKSDEMYKFSKKTTSRKAKNFTGLEYADEQGHLKFKNFKTFEHSTCNIGMCYVVTPSDSRDLDSFYAGIERLYNSIPHGCLHKTIIAQSKALTDLCASYEEKLQRKNLPIPVRKGLEAKKRYFEEIKDRVGWMYVIFLGVGYYPDQVGGYKKIDDVRETYTKFLHITGIKVKPVTDANEYALLYSQMFHMKDLQGIDR